MDILSHGLWGSIIWGRKSRLSFWLAFLFGIGPDAVAFSGFFFFNLAKVFSDHGSHLFARTEEIILPQYVHLLYNITHSFVIFLLSFVVIWVIKKKPVYEMFAWGFHIFLDLFTHSGEYFPTPYAWPFSHPIINGIPWPTPEIFITNISMLVMVYAVYIWQKRRHLI